MKTISIPQDTDIESARMEVAILREKSASERVQMAMELSDSVRETCVAGIRQRHPDYSADMIHSATLRLSIGEYLFKQINSKISPNQK